MDLELREKVILVTGGAKGIGESISKLLAKEGAQVVIIGRNEADNADVVNTIVRDGGKAFQVQAELSMPQQCREAVKIAVEKKSFLLSNNNHRVK